MDYSSLTLSEIKNGYRFDRDKDAYICNYCDKAFNKGQVFSIGGNFYMPEYAIVSHIEIEHEGNTMRLINSETKYNTLTDNQKELLSLFYSGMSDSEIAKKLGVSVSTIRHQKFTFREKAKQYKLYLAVFENVFADRKANEETIVPIHNNAMYYDDRYVITEQEKAHILTTFFESLEPLKLTLFSPKEKNKVIILEKIAEQFESGRNYTEKEINRVLKSIYEDYTTLRRFLIMYGFMDRTKDGSSYWLTKL